MDSGAACGKAAFYRPAQIVGRGMYRPGKCPDLKGSTRGATERKRDTYLICLSSVNGGMLKNSVNELEAKCVETPRARTSERRAGHRRGIDWHVVVTRSTGELLMCRAVDVSEEGLRLRSAHAFSSGSSLRLKLSVPDVGECVLSSRVCYQVLESEAILTGVRFENISPESALILQQACKFKT